MDYKLMAWDSDECAFVTIPKEDIAEAIYYAWNYEFDVYDKASEDLIFAPWEDNDYNSELLKPYGLRVVDHLKHRKLQSIITGEIYEANWH